MPPSGVVGQAPCPTAFGQPAHQPLDVGQHPRHRPADRSQCAERADGPIPGAGRLVRSRVVRLPPSDRPTHPRRCRLSVRVVGPLPVRDGVGQGCTPWVKGRMTCKSGRKGVARMTSRPRCSPGSATSGMACATPPRTLNACGIWFRTSKGASLARSVLHDRSPSSCLAPGGHSPNGHAPSFGWQVLRIGAGTEFWVFHPDLCPEVGQATSAGWPPVNLNNWS